MTSTPEFASPRDMVRRAAAADGSRIAVIAGDRRLSYGELAQMTGALARDLCSAGVGPGVQVALMFANSPDFVIWYGAVLEAGGIVLALPTDSTAAEAAGFLDMSGAWFIAAPAAESLPKDLAVALDPVAVAAADGCMLRVRKAPAALDTEPWTPDGLLLRQYSSGSTGERKHMFKTEGQVAIDLENYCNTAGIGPEDVFLGAMPFYSTGGARTLNTTLYAGGCVSILPRFLPGAALAAALRDRVTVFLASPSMLEALADCRLKHGEEDAFRHLKLCMSGGVLVRKADRDAFVARFGAPVRSWYGSTETYCISIDFDDDFEEGRVGRPMPHVEIAILDDDGTRLPAGTPGEVGIRSPTACAAYVDNPAASALVFRDGWVFPGDRGYLDDAGRLHVLGRADVINIDGYKVDPIEIERVIRDALPVSEVVVLPGTRGGLPAVSVVVEADPSRVTRAMVVAACRARLSPQKVPASVEILQRIERTEAGKIVRSSLDNGTPSG